MGFWSGFTRTAAEIEHGDHRYRVELRLFDFGRNLTLLGDGAEVERASTPTRFSVADGAVIEVRASEYGFTRAVLQHRGTTMALEPAARARAGVGYSGPRAGAIRRVVCAGQVVPDGADPAR